MDKDTKPQNEDGEQTTESEEEDPLPDRERDLEKKPGETTGRERRQFVETADNERSWIGKILLVVSLFGILVLYATVVEWLPQAPDASAFSTESPGASSSGLYPKLWYSIALLSAHAAVVGSALFVIFKLLDVMRRMSVPITRADAIPKIMGDRPHQGDSSKDEGSDRDKEPTTVIQVGGEGLSAAFRKIAERLK